jgi:hypothetical protein
VGLRAPAGVRLVGALAHVRLSVFVRPGRGVAGVVWWSRPPRRWPPIGAARRCGTSAMRGSDRGQQAPITLAEGVRAAVPAYAGGQPPSNLPSRADTGARPTTEAVVFADVAKGRRASAVDGAATTLLPCPIAVSVERSGRRWRARPDRVVNRSAR